MVLLSDPRKLENYALPAMESQKQSNICSATLHSCPCMVCQDFSNGFGNVPDLDFRGCLCIGPNSFSICFGPKLKQFMYDLCVTAKCRYSHHLW